VPLAEGQLAAPLDSRVGSGMKAADVELIFDAVVAVALNGNVELGVDDGLGLVLALFSLIAA